MNILIAFFYACMYWDRIRNGLSSYLRYLSTTDSWTLMDQRRKTFIRMGSDWRIISCPGVLGTISAWGGVTPSAASNSEFGDGAGGGKTLALSGWHTPSSPQIVKLNQEKGLRKRLQMDIHETCLAHKSYLFVFLEYVLTFKNMKNARKKPAYWFFLK